MSKTSALTLLQVGALCTATAQAQTVLLSDDFAVDTSSSYTIVGPLPLGGTQTFAFDYIGAGIPLAPRSAAGTTGGLKLTANDAAGVIDGVTCFHNTSVSAPRYRLSVDVWLNFVGSSGTTEHTHIGVGGDGFTHNQYTLPTSGSGSFLAFTPDGGSASDYRWYRNAALLPQGETEVGLIPATHPSYLGHGANADHPFYQALFPSPPATIAGSPGNIWTTVTIEVDNSTGVIEFRFDGTLVFQGNFLPPLAGQVALGLADIFTSISGPTSFTLYDNLVVESLPVGLGTNYCNAVPNSTGVTGAIRAVGAIEVATNQVTLEASSLPNNAFGFFLTSRTQGAVNQPGGSQGVLCLSGGIGRYVAPGQIKNTGGTGAFQLALNLTQTPTPTGLVSIAAGETWNFQAWHRDAVGGAGTSNFTDGLAVTFQ